jgi:hypothetical protein
LNSYVERERERERKKHFKFKWRKHLKFKLYPTVLGVREKKKERRKIKMIK